MPTSWQASGARCGTGSEPDGQMLDPANEVRTKRLRITELSELRDARGELLEQHMDPHRGQAGPETEVRPAPAEGQVLVGRAFDVEPERVREDVLVAVGRHVPDAHLVAGRKLVASQLGVVGHVP